MIPALVTPVEHSCVAILSSFVLLLNDGFTSGKLRTKNKKDRSTVN